MQTNVACVKRLPLNWKLVCFCFFHSFSVSIFYHIQKVFASSLLSIHSCGKAGEEKMRLTNCCLLKMASFTPEQPIHVAVIVFFIHTQILRKMFFFYIYENTEAQDMRLGYTINSHWIWMFAVCILISIWNECNCAYCSLFSVRCTWHPISYANIWTKVSDSICISMGKTEKKIVQ